jgi:putative transposase
MIDDFNRECLIIDAAASLPVERFIWSIEPIIGWKGKPKAVMCDNIPKYIRKRLAD